MSSNDDSRTDGSEFAVGRISTAYIYLYVAFGMFLVVLGIWSVRHGIGLPSVLVAVFVVDLVALWVWVGRFRNLRLHVGAGGVSGRVRYSSETVVIPRDDIVRVRVRPKALTSAVDFVVETVDGDAEVFWGIVNKEPVCDALAEIGVPVVRQ